MSCYRYVCIVIIIIIKSELSKCYNDIFTLLMHKNFGIISCAFFMNFIQFSSCISDIWIYLTLMLTLFLWSLNNFFSWKIFDIVNISFPVIYLLIFVTSYPIVSIYYKFKLPRVFVLFYWYINFCIPFIIAYFF